MQFTSPKPDIRPVNDTDPDCFDLSRPEQLDLVRSIFLGRSARLVRAAGLEPEDVLQVVYEGLLRKSLSERSCWNPRRGSLSTWLYVAVRGLVLNYLQSRAGRPERPGDSDDVATWNRPSVDQCFEDEEDSEHSETRYSDLRRFVRVSDEVVRVRAGSKLLRPQQLTLFR